MTAQDLKNSILQLAMQGKLVPQMATDEPVSELLKQITQQKTQLVEDGVIKKEKPLPAISDEDIPFDIPTSWLWVRLGDYCLDAFSGKSPVYSKTQTPYEVIGQAANQQAGLDYTQVKYTVSEFWNSMDPKYFLQENDVLLNTLGHGTLGRSGIVPALQKKLLTDGHLFVFRLCSATASKYFYYYLQYKRPEIEKSANGSTNQTFLSLKRTNQWLIPVPPLAEQERIVAKVEELLPLVNEYDKTEKRLTALSAEFPDKLRKSILQQAVQGKLTERNPSDEPTTELLKRIRAEKAMLVAEGKGKADKPYATITDDELPFDLPDGWAAIRIGELGFYRKGPFGSSLTKQMFVPKGPNSVKVYEQKNAIQKDWRLGDYYITRDYFESKMRGFEVFSGDIIVSCAGTIGESYVMPDGCEQGIINQALMRMKIVSAMNLDYFLLYFDYVLKASAQKSSKGAAIKNIPPFETLKNMIMPLPPVEEQKRILEKVDNLLAMCDALE